MRLPALPTIATLPTLARRASGGGSALPTLAVFGGTVTPFTRSGVDYVEVLWQQSGSFDVSGNIPIVGLDLRGGAGAGGWFSSLAGGARAPGGGAAGGRIYVPSGTGFTTGTHTVTIGAGAPRTTVQGDGANGSDSVLQTPTGTLTARGGAGGAGGGTASVINGKPGGCGSGAAGSWAAYPNGTGGAGSQGGNGGAGFNAADGSPLQRAGGAGGGTETGGAAASPGVGGIGGNGHMLDWIATPRRLGAGGGGSGYTPGAAGLGGATAGAWNASSLDATWSSGSGGATGGAHAGKGGDGFLFLVVRADQVNVVAV